MGSLADLSQPEKPVVVTLSPSTQPQRIIGRVSPSAPATIQEFRGIPYGTVPGRWRHSILRTSLPSDVFYATKNGPQCPQPDLFANSKTYQSHLDWPTDVGESEFDCLNLFIVRPSPAALAEAGFDANTVQLPVYVNIHGGGFGFGAGTDPMWDPTRLVLRALALRKPFIAVTINYRLGIFGFGISSDIIATQQSEDALKGGNFGLGDQRIALRWVSQNISAFGGDPARVTIGGQSAGGISVQIHILEAKFGGQPPLFRRAIQQSGGLGTSGPVSLEELDRKWDQLYSLLGISANSQHEKMETLLNFPASKLLAAVFRLGWITYPVVKDDLTVHDRDNGRFSVHLGQTESLGSQANLTNKEPIVVFAGDCENEGVYGPQIKEITGFSELKEMFAGIESPEPYSAVGDILAAYEITPAASLPDFHQRLHRFVTDCQFGYPVHAAREEFRATSADLVDGSPTFPTSVRAFLVKFGNPFPGPNYSVAHHCVDLLYIYDCFYLDMAETDRVENSTKPRPAGWASNATLISTVQGDWINFIVNDSVDGSEDTATVYEVDRHVYHKDMGKDDEWLARVSRFLLLGKHWKTVCSMMDIIKSIPTPGGFPPVVEDST